MPRHGIAEGTQFTEGRQAHKEIANWFQTANDVLSDIARKHPGATPVRCWPHHFDIATLIQIDSPDAGEQARSIGVGMSPGDTSYQEPYWYVTPWPYPGVTTLEDLPEGAWQTSGWTGAVLTATRIVREVTSEDQTHLISLFLEAAIAASGNALRQ